MEPVNDLKKEKCCKGLDAKPNEPPKFTVRPLKKEATKFSESLRVLKYELFSAKPDTVPIDELRNTARDFNIELA